VRKPGQGKYVRWCTAIGAAALGIAGAAFARDMLEVWFDQYYVYTLGPVVLLLIFGYLIYYFVGRNPTVVDFMIVTEGEMKKVNWSSRREVLGATKVVIVTVFGLAFILFVVDVLFILFFSGIGVLRVNVLERLFTSRT